MPPPTRRSPATAPRRRPPAADDLSPIERALAAFFHALDGEHDSAPKQIPVVALRGARDAPYYRHGGDLDIACARRDLRRVEAALGCALRAHGVDLVARWTGSELVQLQLFARDGAGEHHHLCVDLHTAETAFGVPFLCAESLVPDSDTSRGVRRPAAVPSAGLDFLGPYLSGGVVREEYAARLELVLEKHPAAARQWLGALAGTQQVDAFCAALRSGRRGELAKLARPFRRSLLLRAWLRRPLRSTLGVLRCFAASRVTPLLFPRGRTVALLGPDGTGKTTLATAIHEELKRSFRSGGNRTIKLRPGLLPQLGRFAGRQPTAKEYARPHRARPSGTLGTWLRASYYWLDYTLGYALRILPLRRRNSLILFDRWIDDWLVDPARYRMRPNSKFVRTLVRCTPRPDVILVTSASLRAVRSRKREVDARESLRQLEAYESHAASLPRAFVIDTTRAPEQAARDAIAALLLGEPRDSSYLPATEEEPRSPRRQPASRQPRERSRSVA